jgi:Mg-chelatase subunit ChlI
MRLTMKKNIYPFTAIVNHDKIKKALILNAINPSIGGVLIKGDRGTGKTTAVRALVDLLPKIDIVKNSPFNADKNSYFEYELYKADNKTADDDVEISKIPMKVVELPLGATEDRVIGSLDIEKALHDGIKAMEPGILAKANRNILYIDVINLLDDSLVDVILDAAAYGVNIIEREGISISHPSKFILVGTMNI